MASKGKATDMSTDWLSYERDDQQEYWVSCRLDEYGEWQYQYRCAEPAQSSLGDQQVVPRTPGQNYITDTTSYRGVYEGYGIEQSDLYTTSTHDISGY